MILTYQQVWTEEIVQWVTCLHKFLVWDPNTYKKPDTVKYVYNLPGLGKLGQETH